MVSAFDYKKPERIWRGGIETKSHAQKIIAYTAGGFSIFGALALLSAFTPSFDLSKFIVALIFLVPAYSLHKSKSLIGARVLLGISAFALLATAAGWIYMLSSSADRTLLFIAFPAILLFWFVPLLATVRACKAAKFLRRTERDVSGVGV